MRYLIKSIDALDNEQKKFQKFQYYQKNQRQRRVWLQLPLLTASLALFLFVRILLLEVRC
jgi:hypothetical protein